MPQFDPTWYASQAFWVLLTFCTLYYAVNRFVVPKLVATLEERQNKIDSDLKSAERLKTEAERVLSEYESALASAREQSQNLIADAEDKISKMMKEKEKDFSEKLSEKIADNERMLAAEKKQALANMKNLSRTLCEQMIKKLTNTDVDAKDVKQKIAAVMEKLS